MRICCARHVGWHIKVHLQKEFLEKGDTDLVLTAEFVRRVTEASIGLF